VEGRRDGTSGVGGPRPAKIIPEIRVVGERPGLCTVIKRPFGSD
jgi:hypothetical protein